MKNLPSLSNIFILIAVCLLGCTTARETDTGGDIDDFRSWIYAQSHLLTERTEDDWLRTKEEFRRRTSLLDRRQANFTNEVRDEYQQLKEEFRFLDEEYTQLLAYRVRLSEWEQKLLGQYAPPSTLSRSNILEAYATLLENVRTQYVHWTEAEWEMAKSVMDELNRRREEVQELSSEEEVNIKALQMEFTTLETAEDVIEDGK